MNYILRIAVHEDAWKRQLNELLEVCKHTPIQEVMLMEESHKILTAPFPREKHQRMAAIYANMAEAFRSAGVRFSINLVTCVGHNDNPVPDRLQLPFTRFTGDDLSPCHAVYCITDEQWVSYTAEICALYAQTKPDRLMIDDDFRSLNHTVAFGCFCKNHARLVSEKLGYQVTSKQLVDAVHDLGGNARSIREAWMQVNFSAQLHAACAIEHAIHAVSPNTQIGLMNSGEPSHSVQGRDMNKLLRAFAGKGQCLSRPAGGAYRDVLHEDAVAMLTMMSLSMSAVHEDTYWVSEVENFPNSPYNKSAAATKLQMQMHTLTGANALTLNLYDYLATPLPLQKEYAKMVMDAAPTITEIERLRKGKTMRGVGIPWRSEAALHRINRSHTSDDMMPQRPLDNILPLLGIPVQFTPSDTNIILGDDALCYSKEEIQEFLSRGLILDNIAAEHLYHLGFGDLLGCTPNGQITGPCVEQITNPVYGGEWTETLICTQWESVYQKGEWITRFVPDPEAVEICRMLDDEKNPIAPSMMLYHNKLGGVVCVMAGPVCTLGWLCRGRGVVMQNLIEKMPGGELLPIIRGGANLAPFYYVGSEGNGLLCIANFSLDSTEAILPEHLICTNALEDVKQTRYDFQPFSAKFYNVQDNSRSQNQERR